MSWQKTIAFSGVTVFGIGSGTVGALLFGRDVAKAIAAYEQAKTLAPVDEPFLDQARQRVYEAAAAPEP